MPQIHGIDGEAIPAPLVGLVLQARRVRAPSAGRGGSSPRSRRRTSAAPSASARYAAQPASNALLAAREAARERGGRRRGGRRRRSRPKPIASVIVGRLAAVERGARALHDVAGLVGVVAGQPAVVLQVPPRVARACRGSRCSSRSAAGRRRRCSRRRRRRRSAAPARSCRCRRCRRRRAPGRRARTAAAMPFSASKRTLAQHGGARRVGDPRLGQPPARGLRDLPVGERAVERVDARAHAGRDALDVARIVVDRLARDVAARRRRRTAGRGSSAC